MDDTLTYKFLINFEHHVTRLKEHNITLPDPILAFRALKSANLTLKKRDYWGTMFAMSKQLKSIMSSQFSDASSCNTPAVKVKSNEIDVAYSENDQVEISEVLYGCSSSGCPTHFHNKRGSKQSIRGLINKFLHALLTKTETH